MKKVQKAAYSRAREMTWKSEGWGSVQGQISNLIKTYETL